MYSRAVLKSYIFMKYYMLSKNLWFQSNTMQSNYLVNVKVFYTSCCFQKWAGLPDALYTHFECSLRLCTGKTSQKNIFRSIVLGSTTFKILLKYHQKFFPPFQKNNEPADILWSFPIFANYSFIHTADENIYIQTIVFLRSEQGCNHEENHSEVRNFNMGTKLKWLAPELRPSRVNFGMWLSRTSCGSIKSVES